MVEANPKGLRQVWACATRYGKARTSAVVKLPLEKAKVRGSANPRT